MGMTDPISGMSPTELASATCVEYVRALLRGTGWLGRTVRVGRTLIEVDTRNTLPRLVSHDLRRRVPTDGLTPHGWLRVHSYAWAHIGGTGKRVRVLTFTDATVDLVVLDSGGRVHTVDRGQVSGRPS